VSDFHHEMARQALICKRFPGAADKAEKYFSKKSPEASSFEYMLRDLRRKLGIAR